MSPILLLWPTLWVLRASWGIYSDATLTRLPTTTLGFHRRSVESLTRLAYPLRMYIRESVTIPFSRVLSLSLSLSLSLASIRVRAHSRTVFQRPIRLLLALRFSARLCSLHFTVTAPCLWNTLAMAPPSRSRRVYTKRALGAAASSPTSLMPRASLDSELYTLLAGATTLALSHWDSTPADVFGRKQGQEHKNQQLRIRARYDSAHVAIASWI